jgi:2-iminobutanoate/2-iminopropanoate deaminase
VVVATPPYREVNYGCHIIYYYVRILYEQEGVFMARKAISSVKAASVGPYSHGIYADGLVFLSGQTPLDTTTGKVTAGGINAQVEQCFKNLFGALEAGSLDSDDVVKVNVYLTDMNDFQAMNEIYKKQFSEPYPARTTIGVASLPLGAKIEIEMIACKK